MYIYIYIYICVCVFAAHVVCCRQVPHWRAFPDVL